MRGWRLVMYAQLTYLHEDCVLWAWAGDPSDGLLKLVQQDLCPSSKMRRLHLAGHCLGARTGR